MAQDGTTVGKRARLLVWRYGARGKVAVVLLCTVLVLGVGALGVARTASSHGIVLTRADEKDVTAGAETPVTLGDEVQDEVVESDSDSTASPQALDEDAQAKEEPLPTYALVHVDGAVVNPGVYEVHGTSPRVNDVVELAGGLTAEADTTTTNLAAPVADGQKVHIPTRQEVADAPEGTYPWESASEAPVNTGTSSGVDAGSGTGLININTASEAELQALPGVGEATARAIVEERSNNGSFSVPEDIMRVSGIGEKKFAKMKDNICV